MHEDMSEVDALMAKGDYSTAIIRLSTMKSNYAKKVNSKAHVEHAISILKNIEMDKATRYASAKEILEKAASLDPKNKEAKTYYLMVVKLSQNV